MILGRTVQYQGFGECASLRSTAVLNKELHLARLWWKPGEQKEMETAWCSGRHENGVRMCGLGSSIKCATGELC